MMERWLRHKKKFTVKLGVKKTTTDEQLLKSGTRWSAIFTVTQWLDSHGRENLRKFRLKKDGRKYPKGSAFSFIEHCNYS